MKSVCHQIHFGQNMLHVTFSIVFSNIGKELVTFWCKMFLNLLPCPVILLVCRKSFPLNLFLMFEIAQKKVFFMLIISQLKLNQFSMQFLNLWSIQIIVQFQSVCCEIRCQLVITSIRKEKLCQKDKRGTEQWMLKWETSKSKT